ncbi:hypothetical protein QU38_02635, partial [Staphylococcus aureus]
AALAQRRAHRGEDLARAARLGKIMAGTDFEPQDPVLLLAKGAQEDDLRPIGARDAAAGGKPVLARHHDVQDHKIDRGAREDLVHVARAGRGLDLVAPRTEAVRQQHADVAVVVDDEQGRRIVLGSRGSKHNFSFYDKMRLGCCANL